MPLLVEIKLLSDTAPGTGEGELGGIDRSISHTSTGLPLIPARRLKGCLREAAKELSEALTLSGLEEFARPEQIDQLFGRPGQSFSGWLKLEDGHLQNATKLESWLDWATKKERTIFGREAVLANFTSLRAQTAMGRLSGGSLPETLRVSRVINRQLLFRANLFLEQPPSDKADEIALLNLLALVCAALRRMGLSRNRGLGEVQVRLMDGEYDLTAEALSRLSQKVEGGSN
ncbi:MAG: RAMP superfamily CRISPR-associated protein [Chloroflexota bacterium]|nr:hypothetical protein [Chloroflexota bacterium]